MNPSTESNPSGDQPDASASPASSVNKGSNVRPVRRAAGATPRKPLEGVAAAAVKPAPDTAKTIAFAVCGILAVGIVGMGGYLALRTKPAVVQKAPMDHLEGDARALAEKATRAEALYNEGKEKASSDKLADLQEADRKLTEANVLFNEIVDSNQTVEGFKEKIDLARDKKLSIDKELRPIRVKIDDLENAERRNKSKAASGAKAPDSADPSPVSPGGKEPAAAELTDANLDRLLKDDPSEYERLAKIRKSKDPSYVIKKE